MQPEGVEQSIYQDILIVGLHDSVETSASASADAHIGPVLHATLSDEKLALLVLF